MEGIKAFQHAYTADDPLNDWRAFYRKAINASTRPVNEQQTLTDGDVFTLIGHAENLRAMGQSDMPAWFMGLAERIAETIGDKALADRARSLATKGA